MAGAYESRGWLSRVPVIRIPNGCELLLDHFWEIRSFVGGVDETRAVSMSDIKMWQDHSDVILDKWEREAVFEMDRAFRRGYGNSVKFHMKRHAGKSGKKAND